MLLRACPGLRLQSLRAAAFYSVQIVVPALGDSISDGTIATVLKKSGDDVAENETIAQVETDKVTIDIKAPSDGTLLGVVVQEQDTVVPGQLVATLDDSAAKAKLVGAGAAAKQPTADAASPPPPQPSQPSAPAAAPPAATQAAPAAAHRTPGIRFPPRITADGRRISLLPVAEATAIIQQWRAGAAAQPAAAGAQAATPTAGQPAAAADAGAFAAWAAAQRQQAGQPAVPDVPSKFATSVTRLNHMPQRRELSARDMELIELGGALP